MKITDTTDLKIRHKNYMITEKVFVSDDVDIAVLSRKACLNLNLKKRIYFINRLHNWYEEYSSLFKGLGNVKGDYTIELNENAIPYAIVSPIAVPIPLKQKVENELHSMVEKGVIELVKHATERCAPMVVVNKKNGAIRICVDLSRQFHPIPRIELSLAEIAGSKIFSKLGANSEFWQLNLSKKCQDLTTFITPIGIFRY